MAASSVSLSKPKGLPLASSAFDFQSEIKLWRVSFIFETDLLRYGAVMAGAMIRRCVFHLGSTRTSIPFGII